MQERKKCLLSFLGREKALGLDEIRMKSREKQVLLHKKQRDNRDSIEKRKQKAYKKVHEDPTFWKIRFSTQQSVEISGFLVSIIFYVKSNLWILEVQNLQSQH